jgi:hypothetical protein
MHREKKISSLFIHEKKNIFWCFISEHIYACIKREEMRNEVDTAKRLMSFLPPKKKRLYIQYDHAAAVYAQLQLLLCYNS